MPVVADHTEQVGHEPELGHRHGLVRALAAEHLPALLDSAARARVGEPIEAQSEVASHLAEYEDVHGSRVPTARGHNPARSGRTSSVTR